MLITDALVIPGSGDPHWDESARTIIEGVILEVATAERFAGRRNLVTVRDLLAEGDTATDPESGETVSGLEVLEGYMRASEEGAVRRAAADFFERPERERDSVLSTARRHLRALAFPEIAASLGGEGFDLADLKTGAMTVYLCLPGRHMGTCGRWLRLFVNLALQAMERTPGSPAAGCPVLFVLDEFASLGHMRQIEDAAGQIAGYGVKLWPILQDLGQLKALYKERWETFMGNAGVLQFFGNNDLTTLEWVSKRLGSTTIEQLSSSQVSPGAARSGALGESYAPRTTRVLEPEEIALVFGRADALLRQLDHPRRLCADDPAAGLLRQARGLCGVAPMTTATGVAIAGERVGKPEDFPNLTIWRHRWRERTRLQDRVRQSGIWRHAPPDPLRLGRCDLAGHSACDLVGRARARRGGALADWHCDLRRAALVRLAHRHSSRPTSRGQSSLISAMTGCAFCGASGSRSSARARLCKT